MQLDIETLEALRRQHPAWRLLASESVALVASFLHRAFVVPNRRVIAQADLAEALEDVLYTLREQRGDGAYPKGALEYLNDWAANDKAWLRKFYPPGSDEPHFDLTPATARALAWLATLSERSFCASNELPTALQDPAQATGVAFEADALHETYRLTKSYPYFLQEWGSELGPVRAKLIKKGMIYSPAHGDMAFTAPLFDESMVRAIPASSP